MASFHEQMMEYKRQLQQGHIQAAYQGLMHFFGELRSHFKNKYAEYSLSSGIYYGYMDITYFAILPEALRRRDLKIAILFHHESFRFEVWLAAKNKTVQEQYRELFEQSEWDKYHITPTTTGVDYIIDHVLVQNPDFNDIDNLTDQIESGTIQFIMDIEAFLSKQPLPENKTGGSNLYNLRSRKND